MVEIRDQTKITSLQNAWYNCGVLNTASTGDSTCLPISDVRNVKNINYAFAVDDDFKGKKSYIDNVATMETVDPNIVENAVGTLENNQLFGTSTGAKGEENRTNLKTMFAKNVDLTINDESFDKINGQDIFNKLKNALDGEEDATFITHTHQQYIPYLDGHTKCFPKTQGTTTIGTGQVAAINKKADTNEFYFDKTLPKATDTGLLQTEVEFKVDENSTTKHILSKTINLNEEQQESRGDTQSVSVNTETGNLTGIDTLKDAITFSWDGTPCTKQDLIIESSNAIFPNNMHFRICHEIKVKSGTTLPIGPGAKIGLDKGGSIVIESGASVNVETGGEILIEGTIANNGTITNNGGTITIDPRDDKNKGTITNKGAITNKGTIINNSTIDNNGTIKNDGIINTVKDGINGNPVDGKQPIII